MLSFLAPPVYYLHEMCNDRVEIITMDISSNSKTGVQIYKRINNEIRKTKYFTNQTIAIYPIDKLNKSIYNTLSWIRDFPFVSLNPENG